MTNEFDYTRNAENGLRMSSHCEVGLYQARTCLTAPELWSIHSNLRGNAKEGQRRMVCSPLQQKSKVCTQGTKMVFWRILGEQACQKHTVKALNDSCANKTK